MSWGVDIQVDHEDGYVSWFEVVDGHTYNLTRMWREAGVIDQATRELDGKNCRDMQPALVAAMVDVWTEPAKYRAIEPENGWGDFEGFVEILTKLTAMCHQHPTGTLRWNG